MISPGCGDTNVVVDCVHVYVGDSGFATNAVPHSQILEEQLHDLHNAVYTHNT